MRGWLVVVAAALTAAACGEEGPTTVGGDLLPPGSVRTFEVLLDPGRFMVLDTAFAGYVEPADVTFMIVAEDFEQSLDAHALAQFTIPGAITVRDTAGVNRVDSNPTFIGGRLIVRLDTLNTVGTRPIELRLSTLAERFDPGSATWTQRIDSGTVELPWSEPGGTRGVVVNSAMWDGEADSLVIDVDSATIALWEDTATAHGALLDAVTSDVRVRIQSLLLEADARPSIREDTVVTVDIGPTDFTSVIDPLLQPVSATPRVGGVPAWRTYMRMKARLDTLTLPCPDGSPAGCTLRLGDAAVTLATLVFEPVDPPPGHVPTDSLLLGVREVIVTDDVPLARSPLSTAAGLMQRRLPAERFATGEEPVEVPLTEYLRAIVADTATTTPVSEWIAVLPLTEGAQFGFVQFAPLPRLRIVLTIASRLNLQ